MAEPDATEVASTETLPPDVGDLLANGGAPDGKAADGVEPAPKDERYEELLTQLRRQSDMIARRDRNIDELGERTKKQDQMLSELVDRQRNAEVRGYGRAEAEVRGLMKRAVAEADTATYDRLESELVELQKLRPTLKTVDERRLSAADPPPAAGQQSPVVSQWVRDNPWFGAPDNEYLTFAAQGAELAIKRQSPHLSEADRLAKVREQMEKDFPDKFENKARKGPAAVAQPSAQAGRRAAEPKKKTADDLPAEDRATMEMLVRQKVLTREQYLKDYQWK